MLEVSLRALEEATVQQDGTAWQASVFDGAMQADGIETYHVCSIYTSLDQIQS